MRELKFRAWVSYGEKLKEPNYSLDYDCLDRFFEDNDENDIDQCIEQYTGIRDKNGKEIYEGDILGGIWEDGYIAYCDKCKQFQYHCNGVGCMACSGDVQWYELVDDKELEVIGNIHEDKKARKRKEGR